MIARLERDKTLHTLGSQALEATLVEHPDALQIFKHMAHEKIEQLDIIDSCLIKDPTQRHHKWENEGTADLNLGDFLASPGFTVHVNTITASLVYIAHNLTRPDTLQRFLYELDKIHTDIEGLKTVHIRTFMESFDEAIIKMRGRDVYSAKRRKAMISFLKFVYTKMTRGLRRAEAIQRPVFMDVSGLHLTADDGDIPINKLTTWNSQKASKVSVRGGCFMNLLHKTLSKESDKPTKVQSPAIHREKADSKSTSKSGRTKSTNASFHSC